MKPGDFFILNVYKPKSTIGSTYKVFKKVDELNYNVEYWYYNDNGKPQTLYDGEFEIVNNSVK